MRALSSTGWTSGAATYDSGFETHNLDRPAPRCLALLSGLVEVIPHLVPSPVAFSTSQPPRRFRVHSKLPKPRDLQHNHARYDAFGELAAEYSTTGQTPPCTTCYLSTDHLGSIRLVTDASTNVVARHDFLPFGEEIPANTAGRNGQWGSTTDTEQKFTGQIRDNESGMDFFNARYFAMPLGRFTSPDPGNAGADPSDPQSWNAYSYVKNGPMNAVDPSGMYLISPGDPGDWGGNPCFVYDGSCEGPGPVPPPCWNCVSGGGGGGGGGGGNSGSSSGSMASAPFPVGSFPGGETLGLPPGLSVPLPGPAGLLGIGLNSNCEFGVCVGGVGPNGYLDPATVGAGAGGVVFVDNVFVILADAVGGAVCVGSGVCEVAAVGAAAAAVGAGGYLVYKKISKKSGKQMASDTPSWVSYHPPKRPDESCAAFAERVLEAQYGPGGRKTLDRGPGSEFSKIKKACERGGL